MMQTRYFYSIIIIICSVLSAITEQVDVKSSASRTEKHEMDSIWRECDLKVDELPDYYYFINAQYAHYNLTMESKAACAVKVSD